MLSKAFKRKKEIMLLLIVIVGQFVTTNVFVKGVFCYQR